MYSTLRCYMEAKQRDIRRKISSQIFQRKTMQGKNASSLQHKKICKICIKLNVVKHKFEIWQHQQFSDVFVQPERTWWLL
ncbi:unnamed protein product [Brugia timori]|uniref:Ovule protein n=1 Tax=Brugia timori TaxID=42155 RepID=A0A0R3QDT8_9BILA|nr:unnamed protein product [Brugia timori]